MPDRRVTQLEVVLWLFVVGAGLLWGAVTMLAGWALGRRRV